MGDQEFVERRCSDEQCNKARTQWVEETLWPRMRIQIATMIGGTVVFMSGVFFYMSSNAIRDYDLVARDRYTTAVQHNQDMLRIENKITNLESSVNDHLTDVRKLLERNYSAINALAVGSRR